MVRIAAFCRDEDSDYFARINRLSRASLEPNAAAGDDFFTGRVLGQDHVVIEYSQDFHVGNRELLHKLRDFRPVCLLEINYG